MEDEEECLLIKLVRGLDGEQKRRALELIKNVVSLDDQGQREPQSEQ